MMLGQVTSRHTLCIIKPDIIARGAQWEMMNIITRMGFTVNRIKNLNLTADQANKFYQTHSSKSFFSELCRFITLGHILAAELEIDDQNACAITLFRRLIGATDPEIADYFTLRKMYGTTIMANAVHGSDSIASFNNEVEIVFGSEPR